MNDLLNMLIGFDTVMSGRSNYPPYNIYQDEAKYTLELAVAGFSKEDLEVSIEKNKLLISAKKKVIEETRKYLTQNLGLRSFTRSFHLAPYIEVKDINLKDGILIINLEKVLPEELKPKVLPIG